MANHSCSITMAAQEVNGVLNIGAWDYGAKPDMPGIFKSFSISWSGYDKNGKAISGTGTPTIMQKSKTYIEGNLNTALDFGYRGSATGTLVTTYATYTCKITWGSKGTSSSNSSNSSSSSSSSSSSGSSGSSGSVLSITSFIVDDANTTGMVDGKYVIGTKLRFKTTVKSTYGTKSVRFVLTGAKESDNSWDVSNQTVITADSTAIATGVINAKCIVTDKKGNTASKTLDVTIYGEGNNYYAYYFFNNNLVDAFKQDLGGANIILYNVYGVSSDQVDPRKKTIQCYGHNYKTYNDVKNKKHSDSDLTLITSFVVPDEKNVPKSVVHLTENEFKKLKKFKGLVFKIQNNNCLTVHDVKCEVEVIHK